MEKGKTLAIAVVAVVAMLLIAGAAIMLLNGGDGEKITIKLAVGTKSSYEPYWIADHYGFFEDEGIEVEMMYVSGGGAAATALLAGQVDSCLVGASDPAVRLFEETEDGMIISSIYQAKSANVMYFAVRDDATAGGLDLSEPSTFFVDGQAGGTQVKYRVGLDTTTGYRTGLITYFYKAWQDGKLTDAQYQVATSVRGATDGVMMHIEFANQVIAITNGEVAAICGGNTEVVASGNEGISVRQAPSSYATGSGCVILASGIAIEEKRDGLVKMLRALDKACAMIEDNDTREEVAEYCVQFYGADSWNLASQLSFFERSYWDICRVVGIEDLVAFNAYLLGYEDRNYTDRFAWSFVEDAHDDGSDYIYDPVNRVMLKEMPKAD